MLSPFRDSFVLGTYEERVTFVIADLTLILGKLQDELVSTWRFDKLKLLFVNTFHNSFLIALIIHLEYRKILIVEQYTNLLIKNLTVKK